MTCPIQSRTRLAARTRHPSPLAWKRARPRGWSRGRTEAGHEIGTSPCGSRGALGVVVETRGAISSLALKANYECVYLLIMCVRYGYLLSLIKVQWSGRHKTQTCLW